MLYAAAIMIAFLGVAHSVLGERAIITRLLRQESLPKLFGSDTFTRQTLRYTWHLTTVLALGVAWMLVQIADGALANALVQTVAVTLLIGSGAGIVMTRGRHLSWVVMLMAAVICLRYAGMPTL